MKHPRKLLWKTLVREYYRQNAGFFLFFFLFFFGIVAPSQQLTYHYSLIRGIVDSPPMLVLVLFFWLLYAVKCSQWITSLQQRHDHTFLQMLPLLGKARTFRLLSEMQIVLYLPIILYAVAAITIAIIQSAWVTAIIIIIFIAAVCLISAAIYQYALFHPGSLTRISFFHLHTRTAIRKKYTPYWYFLLRGMLAEHKLLLAGIKLFGCGILYVMLKTQKPDDYDIRMPFLVFSIALFGHGALIYQVRRMETQQLLFFRGMPVPMLSRWMQYGMFYLVVLLPELITIGWLMPYHIRLKDALGFVLAGYSTLLLLNSCLFIASISKSDLLKLTLGLFGILYFGVLSDNLILFSGLMLSTAGGLFFRGYCRWEG